MAFDSEKKRIRYVDGDPSDWKDVDATYISDQLRLFTAFDERHRYIYINAQDYDFENDHMIFPIMTNREQGNAFLLDTGITFSHHADFLIHLRGKNHSKILVDPRYDPFYFLYHELLNLLQKNSSFKDKNTGIFTQMYQALSAEIYLPLDDVTIPFSKHETGILTFGNANPKHDAYDSLSDFLIKDQHLEIKIPWQLLNISDPS